MRALAPLLLAVVVAPAASWVSAPLARSRNTAISAKKKGGGGKKKGGVPKHKQQSSFEKAANFELKPYESNAGRQLAELVVNSYGSRTGKPIHGDLDDRLQPRARACRLLGWSLQRRYTLCGACIPCPPLRR